MNKQGLRPFGVFKRAARLVSTPLRTDRNCENSEDTILLSLSAQTSEFFEGHGYLINGQQKC